MNNKESKIYSEGYLEGYSLGLKDSENIERKVDEKKSLRIIGSLYYTYIGNIVISTMLYHLLGFSGLLLSMIYITLIFVWTFLFSKSKYSKDSFK
jgi:putative flippase GtrA